MAVSAFSEHTDFAALARHLDLGLEQPLGPRAWSAQARSGAAVVLKSGPGASGRSVDLLTKFITLYPPFEFPRITLAEPDSYLVYAHIPGKPLSDGAFESEPALEAAFELSGRITALFRSLKLAAMFQGLHHHGSRPQDTQGVTARRLAALGSGLNSQIDGLALRRWEASQSYAWAQEVLPCCASRWPGGDGPLGSRWEALRLRVETVTSIHLVGPGSHLAHTNFTPDHLLEAGNDRWGVVGWQVAPRPYNYMRYKYLAWCLVHTGEGEIEKRYRRFLDAMPAIRSGAADSLTFALCLLESWAETEAPVPRQDEKLGAIGNFIDEALALAEAGNPAAQCS